MDRKLVKKPLFRRKNFWYLLTGTILFLVLFISILSDNSSTFKVEKNKIIISTVGEGDFQEFIPVIGTVLPKTTYYLDAVLGGIVEQKFVEEGATVKKGDKILKLSNPSLQLSALQNEAATYQQINEARNSRLQIEQYSLTLQTNLVDVNYNFLNSKQVYERDKLQWEKRLISQQEYELAVNNFFKYKEQSKIAKENWQADSLLKQSQLMQINESIKRLSRNLDLIRENIDNLTVKAPIDGQLTSLDVEIGQSKSSGDQLGQIDALDGFKVRADIDEFYISRVIKGLHATAEIEGKDYDLSITKVFPEVKSGKFQVDMIFESAVQSGVRRGQTLHIRLQLSEKTKAMLLPRGGFYHKTGGQWVFVLNNSGIEAVKKDIILGRQNPDYFEVLNGLNPGDKVVTSSYDNFGDASKLIFK